MPRHRLTHKAKPSLQKVSIQWCDARSSDDWKDVRELLNAQPPRCETLGFLVRQESTYIEVARDRGMDDYDVGGCMTIPRAWIDKITKLK